MGMYDPVLIGRAGRKLNADGTITIKCRICGKDISRQMYRGFSTAVCAVCQNEVEKGKTPDEILAMVKKQEENLKINLYNEIGPNNFRVIGIGKRIKDFVQEIREKATRRRRTPLFANKDAKK